MRKQPFPIREIKSRVLGKNAQTRAEAKALGKTFAIALIGATALITIAAISESRR